MIFKHCSPRVVAGAVAMKCWSVSTKALLSTFLFSTRLSSTLHCSLQQLHFIDTLSKLYMLFLFKEKLKSVWLSVILLGSPLYSDPAATVPLGAQNYTNYRRSQSGIHVAIKRTI